MIVRATRCVTHHTIRQVILQATTTARRAQHKSFLERVPILEQLTEYEILTIADALVEDAYEDGDVVCTQGEVGDAFYIIKKVFPAAVTNSISHANYSGIYAVKTTAGRLLV